MKIEQIAESRCRSGGGGARIRRDVRRRAFVRAAALFVAGALMPSLPLQAQEATPPPPEEEIVVEGRRNRNEIISSYVNGLTAANPNNPLARYAPGDYCPTVLGLSPTSNKQITTRMRRVAAAAGVKPAEEDCAPSAVVIFTDDKAAFVRRFRARHPQYFTQLQGKGRRLAEVEGPAVAWHIVQPTGTQAIEPGGLFYSSVTPVVTMSVVVVEVSALNGLTTTQVADYVLMRTLTDREPPFLNVPNDFTILKALRAPMASEVPASLTKWDLAYLKGRYTGHPGRYSARQEGTIRGMMRRALAETAKD